ncbi:MAG: hypothetical protein EXQ79_09300 [Acidimicrobiia bacterium]|nr:hypothetical protein [Acidimicrobiia bacterium]
MTESAQSVDGPSRRVKAIVLIALTLLLVAGVSTIEAWPFTGWRLYSNTKGPTAGTFVAYRVGPDHDEQLVDYHNLPYAFQRTPYILNKFPRSSAREREAACDGIAQGEREAGRPVIAIRVYWELRRVVPIGGERHTKLLERELRYTCSRAAT